jgi:hypothetical protein
MPARLFTNLLFGLTIQIMFCPSCGTEYAIELKYCNRCGANLSTALAAQPELVVVNLTKPTLIIGIVMTLLSLGGFGMLIAGAVELSRSAQMGTDPVIAVVVMGMLTILAVDIFLVRQLAKLIDASLKSGSPRTSRVQMPPATVSQLPPMSTAQFTPAASVTENTTRLFESYRAPAEGEDRTTVGKLKR